MKKEEEEEREMGSLEKGRGRLNVLVQLFP